jgi:hypothetical protein
VSVLHARAGRAPIRTDSVADAGVKRCFLGRVTP